MSAIKISNLVKHFSSRSLYNESSLEAEAGELLILVGANGTGKSTLLNIIAGLVKAKGEVHVAKPLRYVSGTARVDGFLNCEQNMKMWLDKSTNHIEILNEWGMAEHRKIKAERLSLGQQKRVLLGRILGNEAAVYLLDEPLLHLDDDGKERLKKNLNRKLDEGKCIVLATHEPEFFDDLNPKKLNLNEF